jgi:transcriptional regulator with PAS, ATPase and Fis domain
MEDRVIYGNLQIPSMIKRAWSCFVDSGKITEDINPSVAASWQKCKNYGVDPRKPSPVPLDYKLLEKRRSACRELLDITVPLMEKLFILVKDSADIMTLHDREGYLVYFAAQENAFTSWEYCCQVSGMRWSDDTIGTTSVSIAMATDAPAQVIGAEHYYEGQHTVSCYAAPIHDNTGVIIGFLNITCPLEKSNEYLLALISYGAFSIENQLGLQNAYGMIDQTLEMITEALLIFDHRFRVIQGSTYFCELFSVSHRDLIGMDIYSILDIPDLKNRILESDGAFSFSEVNCRLPGRMIPCSLKVTPMRKASKLIGVILLFQESRVINKMVNMIAGNKARYTFGDIITADPQILQIMNLMKNIAATDEGILIEGESGTGKELFAHALHSCSNRKNSPFIVVNCASLPRDLMESELFGYEKGAFTGALTGGNPGKFELANGGTIFLDEIGELPIEIQSKLLRVLDNHRISRIGGRAERLLDIRIIAATNRNLAIEVQKRCFREDLYYRLNIFKFHIPALRERKKDIPILVHYFVNQLNQKGNTYFKQVSPDFIEELQTYSWPGNVRELQNIVVRSFYCCDRKIIDRRYLVEYMSSEQKENFENKADIETAPAASFEDIKRQYLVQAIRDQGGSVMAAAEKLGISKATIYRHIHKYDINLKELLQT